MIAVQTIITEKFQRQDSPISLLQIDEMMIEAMLRHGIQNDIEVEDISVSDDDTFGMTIGHPEGCPEEAHIHRVMACETA